MKVPYFKLIISPNYLFMSNINTFTDILNIYGIQIDLRPSV